jgi:hypothetical protein
MRVTSSIELGTGILDSLGLDSGSGIDGGLFVAVRLVITSSFGVVNGSYGPLLTDALVVLASHYFIAARGLRSTVIVADRLPKVMEERLFDSFSTVGFCNYCPAKALQFPKPGVAPQIGFSRGRECGAISTQLLNRRRRCHTGRLEGQARDAA